MFIHDVRLQFVAFVWIGAWSCDPGRCFRIRFLGWTKRLSSDLWACLLDWRSQRIKFQLAAAPARSDRNTSLHTRIHTVSLTSPGLGLIIYWQRASGKALRLRRPGRQPSRITWLWKEAIGGFTFTCGGCWRGTRPRLYLLKLHRLGTLGRLVGVGEAPILHALNEENEREAGGVPFSAIIPFHQFVRSCMFPG